MYSKINTTKITVSRKSIGRFWLSVSVAGFESRFRIGTRGSGFQPDGGGGFQPPIDPNFPQFVYWASDAAGSSTQKRLPAPCLGSTPAPPPIRFAPCLTMA